MSRRGGRGGGRGGKHSVSKELLKRSAKEAGLDDRHVKVLSDITKPPLFPNFCWKSTGGYWESEEEKSATLIETKLNSSTIYIMNTQRQLTSRFQESAHCYIRPTTTAWWDRDSSTTTSTKNRQRTQSTPEDTVRASMGVHLATDGRYFPAELLPQQHQQLQQRVTPTKTHHHHAVATTTTTEGTVDTPTDTTTKPSATKPDEEEEEGLGAEDVPPEEEDDGEDYTTNYYATDDDESAVGDAGEATF